MLKNTGDPFFKYAMKNYCQHHITFTQLFIKFPKTHIFGKNNPFFEKKLDIFSPKKSQTVEKGALSSQNPFSKLNISLKIKGAPSDRNVFFFEKRLIVPKKTASFFHMY